MSACLLRLRNRDSPDFPDHHASGPRSPHLPGTAPHPPLGRLVPPPSPRGARKTGGTNGGTVAHTAGIRAAGIGATDRTVPADHPPRSAPLRPALPPVRGPQRGRRAHRAAQRPAARHRSRPVRRGGRRRPSPPRTLDRSGDGRGRPGEAPWYASPYVPALPLPVALAVHGGPLPETTVRAVGAALAEALGAAHGQGLTHAGVSPAAVLLTADGPRLTCFGAVRAASADGERRTGLPGLDPGALAPEQASGGRPRPPGDVFALGAVLAYAATGHTVPERDELPPALRPVLASCLARDPADRPTAAALMTALAPPSTHGTVLNSAGSLLAPGWLPGRVVAALARQSSELLAAELPAPARV